MGHKFFISFKTEDISYKNELQKILKDKTDMIDKSLNESVKSDDFNYIMQYIRDKHLSNSTVTIHLIGQYSAENNKNQIFIKRELQSSLFDGDENTKNGILGVVLPSMYDAIYKKEHTCEFCKTKSIEIILDDTTVVKEFSYNYHIPEKNKCSCNEEDRYCVLVKWSDFKKNPESYINKAFNKRNSSISLKTRVRPK